MATSTSEQSKTWRDVLPIHPAVELFPRMSESELRELGEDIRTNGLLTPITIDGENNTLIDGRNRLDAIARAGMEFEFRFGKGRLKDKIVGIDSDDFDTFDNAVRRLFDFEVDPYAFVIAANIQRRHLTAEQKRELIAKVLKAKPEQSNVTVAKQVKADDKTVAKVRRELVSTSEIPKLEKTTGADGKSRKATRPPKRKKSATPDQPSVDKSFEDLKEISPGIRGRATGSAEVSLERRRAAMARLDEPAEKAVDLDPLVRRVITEIRVQLRELSCRSDTERFFAELRGRIDDIEREKLPDAVDADPPADLSIPQCLRRVSS